MALTESFGVPNTDNYGHYKPLYGSEVIYMYFNFDEGVSQEVYLRVITECRVKDEFGKESIQGKDLILRVSKEDIGKSRLELADLILEATTIHFVNPITKKDAENLAEFLIDSRTFMGYKQRMRMADPHFNMIKGTDTTRMRDVRENPLQKIGKYGEKDVQRAKLLQFAELG